LSVFIQNLLASKSITPEQARLLGDLRSAHQQYEAVMLWRRTPGSDLAAIVEALKAGDAAEAASSGLSDRARRSAVDIDLGKIITTWKLGWVAGAAVVVLLGSLFKHRPLSPQDSEDSLPAGTAALSEASVAISTPFVATPAHTTKPAPPANFRGDASGPVGLIRLTWDKRTANETYHLYSATREDLSDARREEDAAIPVNWYNWMPPENPAKLFLAVTRTPPGGEESRLSRPYRVSLSSSPLPAVASTGIGPTQQAQP
jgi:hypothetical protein